LITMKVYLLLEIDKHVYGDSGSVIGVFLKRHKAQAEKLNQEQTAVVMWNSYEIEEHEVLDSNE